MKVVAVPIEMIVWFDRKGIPHPVRFRTEEKDGQQQVIKVNRIVHREKEKIAGNSMIVFTCLSVINGTEKLYEIKYEKDTCRWILYKI